MPTALIIGASRGLGRALAEEHLARGWLVIATVRDPASLADLAARNGETLTVETLDTRDWAGVDALHARLRGRPVDLLLVNAGISGPVPTPIGQIEADVFTEVMLTNALAPARIAERYRDLVAPRRHRRGDVLGTRQHRPEPQRPLGNLPDEQGGAQHGAAQHRRAQQG